jgi:urea transport system substrate-binding protein
MSTLNRRNFMKVGGALAAALLSAGILTNTALAADTSTAKVMTTGLAVTDTTVKVGILHSATGTMAISETGSIQAEKLAIEQINAMGGILGRKVEVIQEDGASDWPTFAEKAKKLLASDKVAAVMGCWTSASRKAALPVFEKENGLLFYPTFYEAKTFYLIGSDYIWPRTSMKIARKHIEQHLHGSVVGEEYIALGDTQFGSVINKIKLKKPDVIYAAVVGGSNVAWFKQLNAAGLNSGKQTMLTISVTEDEVLGIGGENLAGFYSAMKYFQSLDTPTNKAFVAAFKKKWGDKSVIGDVTQAAYLGPWLYKAAVERAGSFDVDKVQAALPGYVFKDAPEGPVTVEKNHHLTTKLRIGQWEKDGQAKIVYTSAYIKPDPFPKGYQ